MRGRDLETSLVWIDGSSETNCDWRTSEGVGRRITTIEVQSATFALDAEAGSEMAGALAASLQPDPSGAVPDGWIQMIADNSVTIAFGVAENGSGDPHRASAGGCRGPDGSGRLCLGSDHVSEGGGEQSDLLEQFELTGVRLRTLPSFPSANRMDD